MSPNNKLARLRIRLRGYSAPDTTSGMEGILASGVYPVLEYLKNHPDDRSDYTRLLAPQLDGGDAWICSRSETTVYADIVDPQESAPLDFSQDPLAVEESALSGLLKKFSGWSYAPEGARYPYDLRGLNVRKAPPRQNNCCTFVEALLVGAWQEVHPPERFEWNNVRHRQMMVWSEEDRFSPITAAVESGMAVAVEDHDMPPRPWTLIQGWRASGGGHTFLVVDHDLETDRVLTLESNSCYRQNGPGYRMIGNLPADPAAEPPQEWWKDDSLWKWKDFMATYRARQQANLRVKNLSFSGLPRGR